MRRTDIKRVHNPLRKNLTPDAIPPDIWAYLKSLGFYLDTKLNHYRTEEEPDVYLRIQKERGNWAEYRVRITFALPVFSPESSGWDARQVVINTRQVEAQLTAIMEEIGYSTLAIIRRRKLKALMGE